ncbi:MAG: phosphoserine phosphatase RsbU/P [Clostridiales bacterium]|nr:phosphoserine phosphatase RsbU/P [Clostridiales bacterium]MDN5281113.1 phosphoserine phosphatase RsbU/P [Candidatus Ozemobacter sp.]
MKKPGESKDNASNFFDKAICRLVMAFCLFLFPLFIISASLTRLYNLKTDLLRNQTHQQLTQTLEVLENFSSDQNYFHSLLKRVFTLAQKQKNPELFLQKNINNLKKQYPDSLEFIVWDNTGRIIPELTDEKGFKFILSRLYQTLSQLKDLFVVDMKVRVSDTSILKKNRNLIARYLGRFFIPEHLKFPYLSGKEAGPAKVDFSNHRSDYWYHIGDKISFLVFFSNNLLESSNGLIKLIKSANRPEENLYTGYVIPPNFTEPQTDIPSELKPELTLALARFEELSQPIIEARNSIVAVKVAGNNLRIFSMKKKDPLLWSVSTRRNISMVRIVAIIFLAYLLIYFYLHIRQSFVSIRLKLTMVFLFANLIPLIVLAFIGYDFIESKAISIRNDFVSSSLTRLKEFDARYESKKEELKQFMNKECNRINSLSTADTTNEAVFSRLKSAVEQCRPSEAYLISSDSRQIFSYYLDDKKPAHSSSYVIPMISAALQFINGNIIQVEATDVFKALLSPANSELIRHAHKNSGKVVELNTGNNFKTSYQYAFGAPSRSAYNYFLMMLWDQSNLNQQYVESTFSSINRMVADSQIYLRSNNGIQFWPSLASCPAQIQDFLEKTENSPRSTHQRIKLGNSSHIAVGMKGKNLSTMVMALVVPEVSLDRQIFNLKIYIILALVLNILLTIAISLFLTHQFMKPINELEKATLAIGRRDFRHRIPALDNDELGYLGAVFNRVTEGLGDLEVARIVQESLFPGNSFTAGNCKIYGKSLVMTTLGGDYYDCFEIDSQHWALVIGDVAGHGVPAGLMMAMAKAGVLTSDKQQQLNPSQLTSSLHRIFAKIKNPNMKRMMTFQYFVFKPETGEFNFANAGHCFPIVVDPAHETGEFIEHVSTPLGIGSRAKYQTFSFKLEQNHALVLYTDGIAEARNSNGEDFGFERLRKTVPTLYDADPEVYYNRILSLYNSWTSKADDDLTIIVLVRGGK